MNTNNLISILLLRVQIPVSIYSCSVFLIDISISDIRIILLLIYLERFSTYLH